MAPAWFPRMGDIPGLDYEPPVPIDRASIPNADAVPRVERREFDGRVRESVWWNYVEDGEEVSTSASPAHGFAFRGGRDDDALATSTLLKRLWEGLELPGEPSDYHFGIQGIAGALWRRRTEEPECLAWYEHLHWLDIRLIQAWPDAVRDEYADQRPDRSEFYSVSAFHGLIELYSREGFLHEAIGVARIAQEFDQGKQDLAELEERLELLRAEDGD